MLFLFWFVARGWIEPVVLIFGALDVAAAVWTLAAINRRRPGKKNRAHVAACARQKETGYGRFIIPPRRHQ